MDLQQAKTALSSGLLSFPITDFGEDGSFDERGYRARLEWLMPYGASALFAAGGTGEGFSLGIAEHERVVRTAVETCGDHTPIIGSAAHGTAIAIEMARNSERAGAAAILLLPHYLTEASQAGIVEHVIAVCRSVEIGVILYNRNVCRLDGDSIARIADACPNFIGFKDGLGDIELMMGVRSRLCDRITYLGGLPTAEVYAAAYRAMGVPVYSSAVFNFIPGTAMTFYKAIASGDEETTSRLIRDFFMPYLKIRNSGQGYAVSIVKAGARIVGKGAGKVRPPLLDLTAEQEAQLARLIEGLGPQ